MRARIVGIAGLVGMALVGCGGQTEVVEESTVQGGYVETVSQNGHDVSLPKGTFATCEFDSGENSPCVWNARTQGNNEGLSFVTLGEDGQDIAYITSREAESLVK